MKRILAVLRLFGIFIFFASCSLEKGNFTSFGIRFDPGDSKREAAPSNSASMDCYAVNVAGEGISGNVSESYGDASTSCMGLSHLSDLKTIAEIRSGVSMTLASGENRTVSVLGIMMNDGGSCPSSNHFGDLFSNPLPQVYTMGSVSNVLMMVGQSLTVPSTYPGSSATDLMESCGNFPTVSSVSPTSDTFAGGTTLTITGTNFDSESTVKIGNVSCLSPTFVSSTSLTCTTPSFTISGTVSISVTTSKGFMATLDSAFYISPGLGQQAYIKAVNAGALDNFGYRVAVEGDRLAVAAWLEDSGQLSITNGSTAPSDNSNSNSGAIYVYSRSMGQWTQEAYIKLSVDTTFLGARLAMDGDTIVSGSPLSGTGGEVHVFRKTNGVWAEEATITSVNLDSSDRFGESIAIDGDTIAVGATQEDSNQTTITNGTTASSDDSKADSGAVYVYTRSGSTWTQEAYIKSPNADASDNFGVSVSIDSDTLVVGAFQEDSNQTTITNGTSASADNSESDAGAAYVFTRSGTTWSQQAYLKAPNAETSDQFGIGVSVSSDTIAVGAFKEDSSDTSITNGTSASGDNSSSDSGAVYVFTRSGSNWSHEAYIKPSNTSASTDFGLDVDIDGDLLAVSSRNEKSLETTILSGANASSDTSGTQVGAAYIFSRSGTTWSQGAYLKAPNADNSDNFSEFAVSISGTTVVVGGNDEDSDQTTITSGSSASSDNSLSNSGAAYVFIIDSIS